MSTTREGTALLASGEGTAGKRTGQRNHLKPYRRPTAPVARMGKRATFNTAAQILWLWSVADYPGIGKGMSLVLQNRAKDHSIRDWRRGTRRPPQWALDLLADAMQARIDSLQHGLALLKNEKGR